MRECFAMEKPGLLGAVRELQVVLGRFRDLTSDPQLARLEYSVQGPAVLGITTLSLQCYLCCLGIFKAVSSIAQGAGGAGNESRSGDSLAVLSPSLVSYLMSGAGAIA